MTTTTSERTSFTLDQVLEVAREVVAKAGADYVYPLEGCTYADGEGNPSCLVGHVIFRLDSEAFTAVARLEKDSGESGPVDELEDWGWLPRNFWDGNAQRALHFMQQRQDCGVPWGEALAYGEDMGGDAE